MKPKHFIFTLLAILASVKSSADVPEGNITFADANVKTICVSNWDTNSDGELSYAEAAAVTDLVEVFRGTTITSFDELQYFTGLTTIGSAAFHGSSLTSIVIPNTVTTIADQAFYGCGVLASITIPNSVTSIGGFTFLWNVSLTSITLPSNLTHIGYGAFNHTGLTSITIPKSVTSIDDFLFAGCNDLASIVVENGNPNYDSRDGCNAIIETVTNSLIAGCKNTVIPNSVTKISGYGAFKEISNLTSITLPDGLTYISEAAFSFTGLTSIAIPSNVTKIDHDSFSGCANLSSIIIDSENPVYDSRENCNAIIETATNTLVAGCPNTIIPNTVSVIHMYAFAYYGGLTEISIPSSVTSIGSSAFGRCGLTSIVIPHNVTEIGNMAFDGCNNLTTVTIECPQPPTISEYTFSNRANATLYVPYGCKAAYEAADYWNEFKEIVVDMGQSIAFEDAAVKAICVANWDTNSDGELSYAEAAAVASLAQLFTNNESITSFDELQFFTGLTSIGQFAFSGCTNLTKLIIPEGVTTIDNYAFQSCSYLTSLSFPKTLTNIAIYALENTPNTVNVFASTTPISIGERVRYRFGESVNIVPVAALDNYLNDENWSDISTAIIPECEWNDISIEVNAKESGSGIQDAIGQDNLKYVVKLRVKGSINGYDFLILRQKMPNLRHLDLSETSIVANDFVYYTGYHSEDNVLGACALYKTKLISLIVPKTITRIDGSACSETGGSSLKKVQLNEGLISIGNYAFGANYSLKEVNWPSTVQIIGARAFEACPLSEIVLPKNLKILDSNAFYSNAKLNSVEFPEGIESIGSSAFAYCPAITSVTVKTPEPLTITDGTFPTSISSATLYVPELATSKEKYYWANGWSGFLKHEEYHPEYDKFYLTEDYEVGDGKDQFSGVGGNDPDADLRPESGFIKEGEEDTQNLDDVNQNITGNGTGASIIGKDDGSTIGNLDINNLNVKISVRANTWYFFCFPYEVTIANCTYPGDYVWKEYQGLLRATLGKGWKTVDSATLSAYEGYAFRCSAAGTLTITFNHPKFGGDRPKTLLEHVCENAQHASWNFVGNPYSSYYEFNEDDFTAPITVWNGSSYTAYSPGDDDYHLRPYEAFFVQKPNGVSSIGFEAERRETYQQSEKKKVASVKARRAKGINPARRLINLEIMNGEETVDRTRVVINKKAKHAYELECDAAKFLSTEAAVQLYSVENGIQMAINERPQEGDIRLGYVANKAGTFSISASRMDMPMILVDTQLGISFDLTLGSYDFETAAGTFDGRFMLRPSGDATAINNLTAKTGVCLGTQDGGIAVGGADGKNVVVYTTSGAQVAQHSGNGYIALKRGIYVVSVDGESAKVSVK
ncbi:MAG: leucine-rich repeat domain-containing protein [Bacteroidaceae bacterium]|nr:leucine-rich repeat domain-containing protein [Bacteroidaceae bacterium]